ncbi:hypothetical protein BDP81DRAFT_484353 [Colletotrichum phormii]|uniref:Uncharacterized protein n=1 Tax=Colletotrichum phormii TaxID=359342 RepID=A0AAI9ZGE6_9PEZI|nr:uncharacterized protein BDP81DRAFT_484353 [Colletotrichum phormii]KAK1624113.1 hypothetical protein BDP81DRAFT_484353 [Colletotrichum phormii]
MGIKVLQLHVKTLGANFALFGAFAANGGRSIPSSVPRPSKVRKGLLSFDELPEWHQDNEYIRHSYQPISGSAQTSFRTLVFLLGEWYILQYLRSRYANLTGTDIFIFTFFLLTALRFDLVGIVVLTLGDFVSGMCMVFWCEPLQLLGSITIFIMVNPKFQSPKHRLFRTLAFVITGMSGFAPLIHGCTIFALIYATKFPERIFPGKFDIVGSSHQLYHILVVFATVTQLIAVLKAFDYNYGNRVCLSL